MTERLDSEAPLACAYARAFEATEADEQVGRQGGGWPEVVSDIASHRIAVPRLAVHNLAGQSSSSGFSTDCRFPYFLSRSLNASTARAFSVVSFSTASIRSARQPSGLIRVSTDLNAPGSRAVGPVVFGLRPMLSPNAQIRPDPIERAEKWRWLDFVLAHFHVMALAFR
jgi:hypothetical protein